MVQICPFLAQNYYFGLYLSNCLLDFAYFWCRNLSYGLLLENRGLRFGKNLAPPILGPFWSKFAPFWPKIKILAYIFKRDRWILLIFGLETFGVFLENRGLRFGKNLAPPISGPFWSKFAPFRPKINILAYIFRRVHWILLIFGIETYLMVFF